MPNDRVPASRNTHIALSLMGELVAALRANDPDAFKCWLSGGVQDLGEAALFPKYPIPMPNILDHVSQVPVLEIDVWPRSASRKEWFAITRRIIQDTIADMNLDPAAEAEVIEAFKGAGLL
jgi:hypothetical protein